MALRVAREIDIPHLDLDALAWDPGPVRRPLERSRKEIFAFMEANQGWVIEGCYGDLIESALPFCTEIRFLNPGVERCVANCLNRPWEASKYSTAAAQEERLGFLLDWVRTYETRDDEFSLTRHRAIFDSFAGAKYEIGAG